MGTFNSKRKFINKKVNKVVIPVSPHQERFFEESPHLYTEVHETKNTTSENVNEYNNNRTIPNQPVSRDIPNRPNLLDSPKEESSNVDNKSDSDA